MKKILTMMIIGILCLSMFSVVAPRARALASETPLEVAEKAATWTISQAISENGGYKWADYMLGLYYDSSVQYGGAGYGTLYLELYKKTGNSMYLDYAKGAAQWIISQAVSDSGGYKWPHHDDDIPSPGWWLSPAVSGIGEFLLQMYKTTGNTVCLDYATGAAQWLMAMAYWGEPGCFIPYNPPNPYGTQAAHGIDPAREAYTVTFLLHMYEETGNSIYLKYVTGTADWLISGPDKIVNPSGYEWRFNRPFYYDYPLDGEGRIALFFYEIYEALGNATYLQYARGTMNWLLNQAVVNGDTAKWFDPVLGYCRTLPFSGSYMGGIAGFWGVPEPNELLMAVYEMTHNATYLDYAKKLGNWITSIAIPEGGGYKFPDAEGGSTYSACQNVRIYNFLSWLYSVTGVTSYSEYADGALQWIIFNATEANGGYEWRTISYFPYYASWFEGGTAGVGYYLASTRAPASGLKRILIVNNAGTFGETWYLPDGTPFTLMSFLRDKGFLVDVWTDISNGRALSLDILSSYDVVILPSWFFDVQGNLQYQNALLNYVNQGGGLLFAGQSGFAQTLDGSLGFKYVDGGFVDASIVDSSHPIMQGISELPKAGGVFVDWDNVIADSPLPSNVAILARTTDSSNRIALIAFEYGNGRVVTGPWDGLLRPYGPTGVDSWSPTSEPVTENKLLINAINWVARAQAPQYDVTIKTYCNTEQTDLSLDVSLDSSATFATPHTFVGLTGMHTFTVPQNDGNGHNLKQWSTGAITDTISLGSGGTFTAFYQAESKPVAILTVQNDVANIGSDVWFYGDQSYTPDGSKIKSFYFDFDDRTNSGWVNYPTIGAIHAYNVPGEYSTKLRVINNEGLESEWSAPHKVTVLSSPGYPVACLTATPTEASVGTPITFDASSSYDPNGRIVQYGFDFGDGYPISWTTNPIVYHTYAQQGEYYSKVTAADNSGLETVSGPIKVTIPKYYTDWKSYDHNYWYTEPKGESDPPCDSDTNLVFTLPAHNATFQQKVATKNTLSYGRFIVHFKMSKYVTGLLGSFFLYYKDPKEKKTDLTHQEIDVEWWGKESSYEVHFVFWQNGGKGNGVPTEDHPFLLPFQLDDEKYHTCEIDYQANKVVFIIDGTTCYEKTIAITPPLTFFTGQVWAREWAPPADYKLYVDSTEIWQDSTAPTSTLSISAKSPVNLFLTDPLNRSIGTDPNTGQFVNEIPDAFYTGPYAEPQNILIPEPLTGIYKLNATGTGTGSYTLTMESSISGTVDYHEWQGTTDAGNQTTATILLDTDTRVIVPLQNGARSLITELNESQKDLYLHLYDSQGRHIGLNYTTNQIDLQVPGSYYRDDDAGIIIIVVPKVTNMTLVVDAQYAGETTEAYSLKVIAQIESGISDQTCSGNIMQGTKDIHHLYVPSNLIPIIDDTAPTTGLIIGSPKYSVLTTTYVTRGTQFTLKADDGLGSGVAETAYRISNSTYNSGWTPYTSAFKLASFSDGTYTLAFNSTDNAGNFEAPNKVNVTLAHAIALLSGNKHITLTGSNNVVIITGGNDVIDATQATATTVIKTGAGNDIINLGGGNNIVKENAGGNDIITTGNGNNTITITGNGNYQITTGSGNDQIQITGNGNSIINAGDGNNIVTVSGKGNNQITTGSGNDVVVAGNGNNIIKTGAGDDSITVGNGNNYVDGGAGYDVCIHGTGHNTILNCEKLKP